MQATLIFNPNSGGSHAINPQEILNLLSKQDFDPVYKATDSKQDLEAALQDTQGVILVAGGDGTVRSVATRIIGKDTPLVILPLGTANNIANNLGIEGSPEEIISSLSNCEIKNFDIGYVRAPWGEEYFLESFGYGLFAEILDNYGVERDKSVIRGIESVTETLANYHPQPRDIKLDGEDISGSYLILEAHNTPTLGPRLRLAPDAKTDDGLIDVVRIRSKNRDSLLNYLTGLVTGNIGDLPSVEISRGQKLEIEWSQFNIHVDEVVRPAEKPGEERSKNLTRQAVSLQKHEGDSVISVQLIPEAIQVWIPGAGQNNSHQN